MEPGSVSGFSQSDRRVAARFSAGASTIPCNAGEEVAQDRLRPRGQQRIRVTSVIGIQFDGTTVTAFVCDPSTCLASLHNSQEAREDRPAGNGGTGVIHAIQACGDSYSGGNIPGSVRVLRQRSPCADRFELFGGRSGLHQRNHCHARYPNQQWRKYDFLLRAPCPSRWPYSEFQYGNRQRNADSCGC